MQLTEGMRVRLLVDEVWLAVPRRPELRRCRPLDGGRGCADYDKCERATRRHGCDSYVLPAGTVGYVRKVDMPGGWQTTAFVPDDPNLAPVEGRAYVVGTAGDNAQFGAVDA